MSPQSLVTSQTAFGISRWLSYSAFLEVASAGSSSGFPPSTCSHLPACRVSLVPLISGQASGTEDGERSSRLPARLAGWPPSLSHPKAPPPEHPTGQPRSGDTDAETPATREAHRHPHRALPRGYTRDPATSRTASPRAGLTNVTRGTGAGRVGGAIAHLTRGSSVTAQHWSPARWSRGRGQEGGAQRPPPQPVTGAAAAGNAPGAGGAVPRLSLARAIA